MVRVLLTQANLLPILALERREQTLAPAVCGVRPQSRPARWQSKSRAGHWRVARQAAAHPPTTACEIRRGARAGQLPGWDSLVDHAHPRPRFPATARGGCLGADAAGCELASAAYCASSLRAAPATAGAAGGHNGR